MMRRRTRVVTVIVVLALLGTACIWLSSAAGLDASAHARKLAGAESLWGGRDFSSYRMVLEEGNCYTDYEVRAEHVVWSYEASCGRGQPRSVTRLFEQIRDSAESGICEGVGCPCKRQTTVDAVYDEALGYPIRITVHSTLWPNWNSSVFWKVLLSYGQSPCDRSYLRTINVKSLIPHTP